MSLGSDLNAALPELRAQAESRMTETFDFFTATEGTDPVTLDPTTVETPLVEGARARVKFVASQGRDTESGGQYPVVQRVEVHVSATLAAGIFPSDFVFPGDIYPGEVIPPGAFVRVTASTIDQSLIGRVFRVAERPPGGQVTAYRVIVEEVS